MLSKRFLAAFTFAAELHATQLRRGSRIPYLAHLLGVATLVLEYGGDETAAIAALLHDAIEDQGVSFTGGVNGLRSEINTQFGADVLAIIEACTDADTIPKPPWRERKEGYIAGIPHKTPAALLVSCADKLHNARAILRDYRLVGEDVWTRFAGKKGGTLWYYRALVTAFQQNEGVPAEMVAELNRVVVEIEHLAA